MNKIKHQSAASSHYNKQSATYDLLCEANSATINKTLQALFTQLKTKTILDLTCGTGSQVFWLDQKGFTAIGYDISSKMLAVARKKAKQSHSNIKFIRGDMRTTRAGQFDAVITIFNAVGHLTKQDFKKSMKNIYANLKPGGVYVFDIFNLNYLLHSDNIIKLTMDLLKKSANSMARKIQCSTITPAGILASYTIDHVQKGNHTPTITKSSQTLQVYSKQQLRVLLESAGFKVIKQCDIDGGRFSELKTERLLMVAKKPGRL